MKTREVPEAQVSSSWSIRANEDHGCARILGGCLHISSPKVLGRC